VLIVTYLQVDMVRPLLQPLIGPHDYVTVDVLATLSAFL